MFCVLTELRKNLKHQAKLAWLESILILLSIRTVKLITILTRGQALLLNSGDSMQLDCEFYDENYNLFHCPFLWTKSQRDEVMQINIMGNIDDPFVRTGRYRVEFVDLAPKYKLFLYISPITLEDSGNFTCEVRGNDSRVLDSVTHTVAVIAPANNVCITNSSSISANCSTPSVVSFVEDETSFLGCKATGGYPPPNIELYIGEIRKIQGFRIQRTARLGGERGLRVIEYITEFTSNSFTAVAEDDGLQIRCVVKVSSSEVEIQSTGIKVLYRPRLDCSDQLAHVGERNVRIVCSVHANPNDVSYHWFIDKNETSVRPGEVVRGFWTLIERIDSKHFKVELFIRRVMPESFHEYTVIAHNAIGSSIQDVHLRQEVPTSKSPPAMSTSLGSSDVPSDQIFQPSYSSGCRDIAIHFRVSCLLCYILFITLPATVP